MAKNLYIVSVKLEALVMAESSEAAKQIADRQDALKDALSMCFSSEFDARAATTLPNGYERHSLIYHGEKGDITVEEAAKTTGSKILGDHQ